MYAYTSRLGDSAVLVFNFDDIDAAIKTLTRAGINPVAPVHLYDRIDEEEWRVDVEWGPATDEHR